MRDGGRDRGRGRVRRARPLRARRRRQRPHRRVVSVGDVRRQRQRRLRARPRLHAADGAVERRPRAPLGAHDRLPRRLHDLLHAVLRELPAARGRRGLARGREPARELRGRARRRLPRHRLRARAVKLEGEESCCGSSSASPTATTGGAAGGGPRRARPGDSLPFVEGELMDADGWNARYAEQELVWSAGPNRFLVSEVADLPPGRALDLACGEGRNAIWLAEQGWQVTGVDFPAVAIEKARAIAAKRGVDVEFRVADLLAFEPPEQAYDLVLV